MTDPVQDFFESGSASKIEGDPVHEFLTSGSLPQESPTQTMTRTGSIQEPTHRGLSREFMGRAATGALGEAKGAFDVLVEGPAQLLAHVTADIYPKALPGYEFFQRQKALTEQGRQERQTKFSELTQGEETSARIGEVAGNVIGGIAMTGKMAATEGANLVNRLIAAGKTGAVIGAATPTDEKNFWINKTAQVGLSALTGVVAQGLGEGVVKGISSSANLGKRFVNWAKGGPDEVINEAIKDVSPELQQAVQEISRTEKIDPAALGRQIRADSLPIKIKLTAGQARQDPIAISNEMNLKGKNPELVYQLQDQNHSLIQNLNHVRDTGAPEAAVIDHITAGENLIKAGQKIIDSKNAETSALYKKLTDANGGNLPMDGKSFVNSAEETLKEQMKEPFLPSQIRSIMEWFKRDDLSGKNKMTFSNFENLRTILASSSRTAERAGDGNAVSAIRLVRNALEETPITSEVQGMKELADTARKSAREGFEMLKDNPALAAIDSGKAADNNFVQKYIIGTSKKDLTSLTQSLKDDPIALQTIKAGTVNYLKTAAGIGGDAGNFSQHGYNKALQALGPKLDVIFGAEESTVLRTVGEVARDIQLAPKGSYVNVSNTDVARYARHVGAAAIDRITGLPIGAVGKHVAESIMQNKSTASNIAEMLGPAAGVGIKTPSRIPPFVARGGIVPLSSMIANYFKPNQEQP